MFYVVRTDTFASRFCVTRFYGQGVARMLTIIIIAGDRFRVHVVAEEGGKPVRCSYIFVSLGVHPRRCMLYCALYEVTIEPNVSANTLLPLKIMCP